jgi:hypothetical protein
MTWNYTGRPADNERDKVRFLIGDTCSEDQLVSDEEIAYAISVYSNLNLASAMILRSLAAKFSRMVTNKVGDVSSNCTDMAKAFADRAKELDPSGITTAPDPALPVFGGLTISGKETLDSDTDAVQPSFRKNTGDMPGSWDDSYDSYWWKYGG